jgi:hypothetical protein
MLDLSKPQNALLANAAATNAATNLVGASLTAPANFLKAGQVWRLTFWFTFLHTAAATPTLTFELAVAGVAIVALVVTPVATAGTYHGKAVAEFTVRSVGASGALAAALQVSSHRLTAANAGADPAQVDIATDAIDTTVSRLIELRARMTTAVAGNTLTIPLGYPERVVG